MRRRSRFASGESQPQGLGPRRPTGGDVASAAIVALGAPIGICDSPQAASDAAALKNSTRLMNSEAFIFIRPLPRNNDEAIARRCGSAFVLGVCRSRFDIRRTSAAATAAGGARSIRSAAATAAIEATAATAAATGELAVAADTTDAEFTAMPL